MSNTVIVSFTKDMTSHDSWFHVLTTYGWSRWSWWSWRTRRSWNWDIISLRRWSRWSWRSWRSSLTVSPGLSRYSRESVVSLIAFYLNIVSQLNSQSTNLTIYYCKTWNIKCRIKTVKGKGPKCEIRKLKQEKFATMRTKIITGHFTRNFPIKPPSLDQVNQAYGYVWLAAYIPYKKSKREREEKKWKTENHTLEPVSRSANRYKSPVRVFVGAEPFESAIKARSLPYVGSAFKPKARGELSPATRIRRSSLVMVTMKFRRISVWDAE